MTRFIHLVAVLPVLLSVLPGSAAEGKAKPNIVYILADDLGYGDVRCLNPEGKIATPNLDRLAAAGMKFTDVHSASAVCTPTRYGILTGRYCCAPPEVRRPVRLFAPPDRDRPVDRSGPAEATRLPHCLHRQMASGDGLAPGEGGVASGDGDGWKVDYAQAIRNGPNSVGFDDFFGIGASLDMPPYVWIENDRCRGVPTVEKKWIRKGPAHKDFEAGDGLPTLTARAVETIGRQAGKAREGRPFFLYLPLSAAAYADPAGSPLEGEERHQRLCRLCPTGGCRRGPGSRSHRPRRHCRQYVGPVRQRQRLLPGGEFRPARRAGPPSQRSLPWTQSGHLQGGTSHSAAGPLARADRGRLDLRSARLPERPDGHLCRPPGDEVAGHGRGGQRGFLPALLGHAGVSPREGVVHHSINGSFAIRQGKWAALCPGSGGWSLPRPGRDDARLPPVQLYDLAADPGEQTNLQEKHPEVVAPDRASGNAMSPRAGALPAPGKRTQRK